MGLSLLALVLPAHIQDRDGAKQLLTEFYGRSVQRRVKHIWANGGFAGVLVGWARQLWHCKVAIVKRSEGHTFRAVPRRWLVERSRCLNRDYERPAQTSEIVLYLAMNRLMLARRAKSCRVFKHTLSPAPWSRRPRESGPRG